MSKTKNYRITKKDKGLIKAGMRRAFSRSELHKKALEKSIVKEYGDPSRKRVTKWSKCSDCGKMEPTYLMELDHVEPVVPIDTSFDEMSLDEAADRLWCSEDLLKPLCHNCHRAKSQAENKERRANKKLKGIK